MKALLTTEQISTNFAVEEGDAAIILKKDGTFRVVNCHASIDGQNLTPEQIEQGKKLLGISAALQIPELMQILLNAASDPALFSQTVNLGQTH